MSLIDFPDPRVTSYEGIVAFGGELSAGNLIRAYESGIFPWPIEGWPLPWFCPEQRAVLEFKDLHLPRRLLRVRRTSGFRFTIDAAFERVIRACAHVRRPRESGTWINPEVIHAYVELHQLGRAHSAEAWIGDRLVGGMYGVDSGGAFGGESMFYLEPYASKLALLHMIDHLAERGLDWFDAQVMTPHMEVLGTREIPRDAFLGKLAETQARGLRLFD
jgi:leucyl/phenylalanyl-tRNA--protein transferase